MADATSSKSKIQDGGQMTGSTNISETVIKSPTANLRRSTMANSQEVYLGDSNNHRQSEMSTETVCVCMCTFGIRLQPKS